MWDDIIDGIHEVYDGYQTFINDYQRDLAKSSMGGNQTTAGTSEDCPGLSTWSEEEQACVYEDNEGGFGLEDPNCPAGFVWSETSNSCVFSNEPIECGDGESIGADGLCYPDTEFEDVDDSEFYDPIYGEGFTGDYSPLEYEYLDTEDFTFTTGQNTDYNSDYSLDFDSQFSGLEDMHAMSGEELLNYLANIGFSGDENAIDWFMSNYEDEDGNYIPGGAGDYMAFDQSDIEDSALGYELAENSMWEEYSAWELGAETTLTAEQLALNNAATFELEEYDAANQQRIYDERAAARELRTSSLRGLASSNKAAGRRGIGGGMNRSRDLKDYALSARQSKIQSQQASTEYQSNIDMVNTNLGSDLDTLQTSFNNEQSSEMLSIQNDINVNQAAFASDVNDSIDLWYQSLISSAGVYWDPANTVYLGEDGIAGGGDDLGFNLFGFGIGSEGGG